MTQGAWTNMYNGSERQTKERWWHQMAKWVWNMALNAKTKKYGDSKYMNGYEKRLWKPKTKEKWW